jgi:hypothetical protein
MLTICSALEDVLCHEKQLPRHIEQLFGLVSGTFKEKEKDIMPLR